MNLKKIFIFTLFIARLQASWFEEDCYIIPYGISPPETFTDDYCTYIGSVEALYWRPYQEEINALKIASIDPSFLEEHLRTRDFPLSWNYGYRLQGGLNLPCDRFAIFLTFTHFLTRDCNTYEGLFNAPISFTPGFNIGNYQIPTQQLSQKRFTHISINKLDLSVERSLFLGPHLVIRPSLSLTMFLLEERFQLNTTSTVPTDLLTFEVSYFSDSIAKSRFKGVGPTLGLNMSWDLGCDLELIGGGSFGVLFGAFKTKLKILFAGNTVPIESTYIDFPFHQNAIRSFSEAFIGLGWKYPLYDGKRLMMLRAGWEQLTLYKQGFFPEIQLASDIGKDPNPLQSSNHFLISDLTFAGFFLSASLWF
jgi:hypothetical protein